MKKCRDCKKSKKVSDFYSHPSCSQGVRSECKSCEKKRRLVRYRHAKKHNPEKRRSVVLKNKYGITFDEYVRMLGAQGGGCGICGTLTPGASKKHFSVDHDHKTGKIRGILCHGCNAGLGMFREDELSLASAINYLEKHKSCA